MYLVTVQVQPRYPAAFSQGGSRAISRLRASAISVSIPVVVVVIVTVIVVSITIPTALLRQLDQVVVPQEHVSQGVPHGGPITRSIPVCKRRYLVAETSKEQISQRDKIRQSHYRNKSYYRT